MLSGSVARRYAKAVFDIGSEQNVLGALTEEIQNVAQIWEQNDELQANIDNPQLPESVRRKIWTDTLDKLGSVAPALHFFMVLFEKGRLEFLPLIAYELSLMTDEKENRVRAEVVTTAPLGSADTFRLQEALQKQTGKNVVLSPKTDPEILGGVITRIGDLMIDGSLQTRLKKIEEAMLGRN